MRTTLAIDDDVLMAARELAVHRRKTVGEIVSELARKSLIQRAPKKTRNGVPLLPIRNPRAVVTMELVNQLRDEDP